ncbi:MAG: hypothetical protein PHE70_09310 [Tepidanaerobacteraceae bacterium]|nr:hypothetical protein [Tepidanaerobacteraceae bacterium]
MVKVPSSVQKVVEHYVIKIEKQIPIKKTILFSSYAKGTYDKDLAIFSDYFTDMEQVEAFKFYFYRHLIMM